MQSRKVTRALSVPGYSSESKIEKLVWDSCETRRPALDATLSDRSHNKVNKTVEVLLKME